MILHVSVTADDPRGSADVLARLLGGMAVPIGPAPGSWTAVGPDPFGNVIEVMPRGTAFRPGETGVAVGPGEAVRTSGFHMLIESTLSESEVHAVAAAAAIPCQRASRGVFGELLELWLDGCQLVEVLPLEWIASWRRLMTSDDVRDHVRRLMA